MTVLSTLLSVIFGLICAAGLLFWGLFFSVVLVRLGDANAQIKEPGWAFLFRRWPVHELNAYATLLNESERRQWYNRYLVHQAQLLLPALGGVFLVLLIASLVAG